MPKKEPVRNNVHVPSASDTPRNNDETALPLETVDISNLVSLQARKNIVAYTRELFSRRHFILANARARALTRGQNTFLGRAWLILQPILDVAVYALIFGYVLRISRGMDNFIGFLTIGVIYLKFATGGLSGGTTIIRSSRNLIHGFNFPSAAIPISATIKQAIDHAVPAVVAVMAALLFQSHKPVSWTVFLAIPLFLLMHCFSLGCMFIVGRITAFIPDTAALVGVLNRGLFFISGVFFDLRKFDRNPEIQAVMQANPIYQFLTGVRMAVLDGEVPPMNLWLYVTAWSFGLMVLGYLFFWQAEERYTSVK